MFTGVPVLVGYLFISYAHFSPVTETFVILLYVGRLLTGIAMGSSSAVVGVCMKKCGEPEILVSHTSKAGADACLCQNVYAHWLFIVALYKQLGNNLTTTPNCTAVYTRATSRVCIILYSRYIQQLFLGLSFESRNLLVRISPLFLARNPCS